MYTLKFENDGARKLFISLHTQAESLVGPSTTISDLYNAGGALDGDFYVQKKRFSRVKKKKLIYWP